MKEIEEDYTVLLLYPDYLADNYGEETFLAHVRGKNMVDAILAASMEAIAAQCEPEEEGEDHDKDDWSVLFVCKGHIENEYAGF